MPATPGDVWRSFESTAARGPDETALTRGSDRVSFGELERTATAMAHDLAELGVTAGDLVGVASSDPAVFVALVLGVFRVSAAAVLLSPEHGAHVLRSVLGRIGTRWLVSDEPAIAQRAAAAAGVDVVGAGRLACVSGSRDANPLGESLAIVKLSSGSTAEPKAIAVSASALLAEADAVGSTFALGSRTTVVCPVPLHHSYGFDLAVLPMLRTGGLLAVHAPFVPARLLRELQSPSVQVYLGVPALYRALLEMPLGTPPDLSGVAYMLSCTAPLSPDLIERFHTRFRVPICQHYGASEVGAVTTHVPEEVLARPSSVGRAMPGVEIEIVDGEVVVSGPALASAYLSGAPEPSPFRSGRFHMGDNGSLDPDGFLTITGRRDAVINVGGLKVSPEEVQLVLERHPAVREAAVGGRSDGHGDEFVRAVVAVRGAVTELELISHCRAELEDYKVPRRIELRDELPRLPSGKVDRER